MGSIADTLDDYATAERAAGRSPNTIRARLSYLRRWAVLQSDRVDLDATAAFLGTPGWSRQTRATAAGAIRSWIRWARRRRVLPDLPDVDDVEVVSVPRRRARPLDERVIVNALAAADESVALMILLGREAGLRRAEIAGLHTSDLLPGPSLLVHGKGEKERIAPVSPMLAAHINAAPSGWVFPNPVRAGEPMTPAMVSYRVRKALGGVGTVHQLRHSFACANYALSHDIVAVQELLGHTSVATTQNYVGVSSDVLRASVDAASIAHSLPGQRQACAGPTVSTIEGV